MNQKLELRIYDRSISVDEHRFLRVAAMQAQTHAMVTYLDFPGGEAAIAPVEAAQWWEARQQGVCDPCIAGRHADCPRHHGWQTTENGGCACDNRNVHAAVTAEQVTAIRLARRR